MAHGALADIQRALDAIKTMQAALALRKAMGDTTKAIAKELSK